MDSIRFLMRYGNEDQLQEAWCKALSRTTHRPPAGNEDELVERYAHVGKLVSYIYRHERINHIRQRQTYPLTDDIAVWYNTSDPLEDCTPQQLEAIEFYLQLRQPLSEAERTKLSRLRKSTGLALRITKEYH